MRIFTRYILREVSSYAALGAALFTFVLFMSRMQEIIDLLVRGSASVADALRIFLDMMPGTLTVTIPTAVLAGILLGLSRLAADSEVTAMRSCGIGALTFVRIVSLLSLAALGLGLVNSLYFVPRGAADLLRLEDQLKSSQASFEVQPRVFYDEDFKNYVLYIQDVPAGSGATVWRHVFLADLTQPVNPDVITAEKAIVSRPAGNDPQDLRLMLLNGGKHQFSPTDPNQYDPSTFSESNLPLQLVTQDATHISRRNTHLQALSLRELRDRAEGRIPVASAADVLAARIELQSRFSYPFACLVLMLIGVPLGLSSKRGGKSGGFVLTLLLVFAYYLVSNLGVALATSGKVSPFLGVWLANLGFALFGLLLLRQLAGGGLLLDLFGSLGANVGKAISRLNPRHLFSSESGDPEAGDVATEAGMTGSDGEPQSPPQRLRRFFRSSFPLLLDEYVMRSYLANFLLSLGAFTLLYIVFTFFELMGDIVRNQTPFIVVGEYLWYLIPYIVSAVVPLCSLLAVLIAFGALNRTSELTAMKATGISLYRVVAPVLGVAALLSATLFAFNEYYLPEANRHQEQLRAEIKGRPAQTFMLAGRKWISGQSGPAGSPTRIFYYQAYDPVRLVFGNLTVFEFDPINFTIQKRIHAETVHWDSTSGSWIFENGWQRSFNGAEITQYQTFTAADFPEVREQPAYFDKKDTLSDEMSYADLSRYIADLSQSGFDTIAFRVQLQNKLAVPLVTLVMAILAVPFAVSMGKRSSLVGIATAIGVTIAYYTITGVFSSLGDIATLPPLLAAWSPDLLFAFGGTYLLLRTPT